MTDRLEALRGFIRDQLGYEGDLDTHADLLEEDILDSYSIVELAVYVQGSLDVDLEPEDLSRDNFSSLASILALIEARAAAG